MIIVDYMISFHSSDMSHSVFMTILQTETAQGRVSQEEGQIPKGIQKAGQTYK